MQTRDKDIKAQLFVCTHERETGEACAHAGAFDIFKKLKECSKNDTHWKGKLSVTRCGCLGFCSEGVAAVLYPQRKWLTQIQPGNETEVFDWVEKQISDIT